MKQLYLDCTMGAAGDMLSAALYELFDDKKKIIDELNAFGIPGVSFTTEPSVKCGIAGTHMKVEFLGEEEEPEHTGEHRHHHHHHLDDVLRIIAGLNADEKVRSDAAAVYTLIAQAEAQVHGMEPDNIHFHEVGTMDAIADVMAVCHMLHVLGADAVSASKVRTGFGTVRCAHGILPVPAPATAILLQGIPVFAGDIESEMCTPTGAALLKHFASGFGTMPDMSIEKTGFGMGKKDFEDHPNCVRAVLGESDDDVVELSCNVDDMSPEDVGFAYDALFRGGALDVWYTQISMKKNRPAVILSCLCRKEKRDETVKLMFRYTTTIGIRETLCRRYVLRRSEGTAETAYGPVRYKLSEGYGVSRQKFEYDDIASIAGKNGLSPEEVRKSLEGLE